MNPNEPRARWRVSWHTITPESAEMGDHADHGWAGLGGWRWAATDPGSHEMTLREALSISNFPENSGRWFSSVDPDCDYRTGEDTFYNLHPPENITDASYRRVARLLNAR